MTQQITDFIAKVDQVIAKAEAIKAENDQLKQQISQLQTQIAGGALSADDQAAVAAESAKIDAALAS